MTRAAVLAAAVALVVGGAGCDADDAASVTSDAASPTSVAAGVGTTVTPTSHAATPGAPTPPDTGASNPVATSSTTSVPHVSVATPPAAPVGSVGSDGAVADVETLGPLGETEVDVDTGAGSVQIGAGDVPDEIPAELPLPDDLEVELSSTTGEQAGFSGTTMLDFDGLVAMYRAGLAVAPFELVTERIVGDSVAVFEYTDGDGRGEVAVSSAPGGGHTVLVTFGR